VTGQVPQIETLCEVGGCGLDGRRRGRRGGHLGRPGQAGERAGDQHRREHPQRDPGAGTAFVDGLHNLCPFVSGRAVPPRELVGVEERMRISFPASISSLVIRKQ
jgi:hypothetical protein